MVEEMNVNATPEPTPEPDKEASYQARLQAARETAAKHGYYWSVLSDDEKIEYELALSREGFEQEIALITAKLKTMLPLFPYNLALLPRMLSILERLQKTQKTVFKKEKDNIAVIEEAVGNAIKKLRPPQGLIDMFFKESPGTA